jgi:uncharacterized protein
MELRGSRVLVTGASRGIGAGLARRFAAEGARVALVARTQNAIEALADELGGDAYVADLSQAEERRSMWDRVTTDGPVDILVNNAGVDQPENLVDMEQADIDHVLNLNLHAPIDLCRMAVPAMLVNGSGHIVNVSSMAAVAALPGYCVYSASKAGLSHFTSGLRNELRGRPVGTTLVQIGVTTGTDMADNMRAHPPSARALKRLEQLQLTADVEIPTVIAATVDAVQRGRRHVRLPRRDATFAAMVEFPRRVLEVCLTGVKV